MPQLDGSGVMGALFAEELGLLLEVDAGQESAVLAAYRDAGLSIARIGRISAQPTIEVAVGGQSAVAGQAQFLPACTTLPVVVPPLKIFQSCRNIPLISSSCCGITPQSFLFKS